MCSSRRKVSIFICFTCLFFLSTLGISFADREGYSFTEDDRDPMSPLINKQGLILIPTEIDVTGLNLKGIIYSEGESLAIINEEVLEVGESIGEYIISKIWKKKVILNKGKELFTLKLED